MNRREEVAYKVTLLQDLMAKKGWAALLLTRGDNFGWVTGGGRSHINYATEGGVAQVLLTPQGARVLCNNIESRRIAEEELADSGLEIGDVSHWWDRSSAAALPSGTVTDTQVQAEIAPLRYVLLECEQQRARKANRLAAEAVEKVARMIQPGETEFEVSAQLHGVHVALGFEPLVVLVASDERIFNHRHPLPTGKRIRDYVMLIGCCRLNGIYTAVTRLVHFGPASDEVRTKMLACAHIDSAMVNATRPGARVADIFQRCVDEYKAQGYDGEWKLHHQGGAIGYQGREFVGTPTSPHIVQAGQLYAWNPSITGVKTEDTILVGPDSNENLTETPDWPRIEAYGLRRPDILIR